MCFFGVFVCWHWCWGDDVKNSDSGDNNIITASNIVYDVNYDNGNDIDIGNYNNDNDVINIGNSDNNKK